MAAAFAMVACQTDINEVGVVADGVATVEFEVGTPQMRAYSDGLTVDDLQYAVYEVKVEGENKTLTHLSSLNGTKELTGLSTNVQIELANNKKYAVIFWADDENAPYTFKPAEKTVTVDYNNAKCNDESRDAFYAYKEFEVKGAATLGVELRRPFAQVNVGTSDLAEAAKSNFVPSTSALVVKNVCNVLNLATGEATGGVDVTFKAEAIPAGEDFPYNKAEYKYLAMSYVLVGKDKGSYDVTYTITAGDGTVINNTIGAVPMQANYRTNIYGKLLTSTTDINVEIKPGYNEPANDVEQIFANQLAQGGHITLTDDVVLNNNAAGFVITADTEIDLGGNTITVPANADSDAKALFTVEGDANLTLKNGSVELENAGTRAIVSAKNVVYFKSTGKLVLDGMTIVGSKRGGARAIDVQAGEAVISNSTFNCYYGSGVNSGKAKVVLNNCDITVNGMYSSPFNSVCFSVMYGGELTVNGGNYKMINDAVYATGDTHGGWLGVVMNSGGTLILNDGTFENVPTTGFNPANERAIIEAENNAPAVATVIFAGGKYKPQHSKIWGGYGDKYYPTWVNKEKLTLGEDGWYTIADNKGYVVNGDEYLVSTGAGLAAAVVDAPANAKITLTANVDLTGVDYTPRTFTSLVFNGNYHTISGVKVEGVDQAALFGKTWNFDIHNVTLANSTFSGNYGLFQGVETEDSAAGFIAFLQTYSAGSKLENCHIENCTIGSAKYVGGLVAYKNGDFAIELTNCSVKGSSFVSNYTEDGAKYKGHCGGLIGLTNNITITNCVVANNTFDVLGARGGLFIGSAQHNSAVSGKVEGNTGLIKLCGEVNSIADWSNVEFTCSVSNAEELESALTAGGEIVLGAGTYVIPDTAQGKTLRLIGSGNPEDTTIAAQNDGAGEGNGDYSFDGATVTFENMTITFTGTYHAGFPRMKGTFKNCIINGQFSLYDSCSFENCTLNVSGDLYNVWTWGAPTATFTKCVFNCDGKAVLLYGTADTTLTMNNCTFNDKGGLPDLKAAIEIGNDYGKSYNLFVNSATVNGFEINDKGINTGTTLWANKNSMGQDKLNVVVDGVDVY